MARRTACVKELAVYRLLQQIMLFTFGPPKFGLHINRYNREKGLSRVRSRSNSKKTGTLTMNLY